VLVGVSPNNVDRFGQCPRSNVNGIFTGGQFGCVDHTPPPTGVTGHSGEEMGEGYPTPSWNMFGYMLYDGPVRVFDDRFVNFRKDPSSLLTAADNAFLASYASQNTPTAQACVAGPKTPQHCNVGADCYAKRTACDCRSGLSDRLSAAQGVVRRRRQSALLRQGGNVQHPLHLRGRRRLWLVPVEPERLPDRHRRARPQLGEHRLCATRSTPRRSASTSCSTTATRTPPSSTRMAR
jgi:hypothetical protein